MVDVAHSTLTGADLHEPKGIASAAINTVYAANGAGSGTWSAAASILSLSGMIADFATPVAPTGWLECTGAAVSRVTYADLFTAVTVQQSGVRTSGSAVITGLSSTTNMRAGYYVSGTGLTANSTIVSIDSATQITISANASSSGTATVIISPWQLGDGSSTFNLPDASLRYRRARSGSTILGAAQADTTVSHTHVISTNTGSESASHTHSGSVTVSVSGSTAGASASHTHTYTASGANIGGIQSGGGTTVGGTQTPSTTSTDSNDHSHSFSFSTSPSFLTSTENSVHTHSVSATSATQPGAGTETRPLTVVVMTCIKT